LADTLAARHAATLPVHSRRHSCRMPAGMSRLLASLFATLALPLFVTAACSSETTSDDDGGGTGAGGVDDGKLRPPPSGVRMSEADACEAMRSAVDDAARLM